MINKVKISKIPIYPDTNRWDWQNAFLCCHQVQVARKNQSIFCLDTIQIDNLFYLKEQGVNQIIATRSDCNQCSEKKDNSLSNLFFDKTLEDFNQLLESKSIPTLAIQWIDEFSWAELLNESAKNNQQKQTIDKNQLSRRGFFQKFILSKK